MEIVIAALALLIGIPAGVYLGWRIAQTPKRTRHVSCHMCSRPSDEALFRWQIRGRSMRVCSRCHPFYKLRFEKEVREDTHSFVPESNRNV